MSTRQLGRNVAVTAKNIKNGTFKWAALSRPFLFPRATNGTRRRRRGGWTRAVPPTADRGEIFMRVKASTSGRELSRHDRN